MTLSSVLLGRKGGEAAFPPLIQRLCCHFEQSEKSQLENLSPELQTKVVQYLNLAIKQEEMFSDLYIPLLKKQNLLED